MTLTIDFSPVEEARLTAVAQMAGLKPEELIRQLVAERLPSSQDNSDIDKQHFYFTATPNEFKRVLDEIADTNRNAPVLSPDAFNRESLYDEGL